MTSKAPEVIIVHETVAHSIAKDFISVAALSAAVWLGVQLQSPALQWIAGMLWIVTVIGTAMRTLNKNRMTITDARKRLDEIEAA